MPHTTPPAETEPAPLGDRVAGYRKLRGLSVRGLAAESGVSPSFLSQLERGRTNASITSLRRIAAALGVSIADLVDGQIRYSRGVTRAADRPVYSADLGCVKYVISQAPITSTEIYQGVLAPGGATGTAPSAHDHVQEFLIVLYGSVLATVGSDVYELHANDSVEFISSVPHLVENRSDQPAAVLWVLDVPKSERPMTAAADRLLTLH